MKHVIIWKDSYYDSIVLMQLSAGLQKLPGLRHVTVALALPHNRELLERLGFGAQLGGAGPTDLVIAVEVAGQDADAGAGDALVMQVEATARRLLKGGATAGGTATSGAGDAAAMLGPDDAARPADLEQGLRLLPGASLALISVPGRYAAYEAERALAAGLHVLLFSDNVALDDELALKRLASERGLLCMGPDCGTAIIGGKPLGFANVVRRGPVGIVGASGTGIQEVSSQLDRLGVGVSQAIGTGGRDLSAAIGGRTTLQGIAALAADPATGVIVVLSKPPAAAVADQVLAALGACGKPAVVHFVGHPPAAVPTGVLVGRTLEEAAWLAASLAGNATDRERGLPAGPGQVRAAAATGRKTGKARAPRATKGAKGAASQGLAASPVLAAPGLAKPALDKLVREGRSGRARRQRYLRGYFTGGTLCDEALYLLADAGLADLRSNIHPEPARRLDDPRHSQGHCLLDLGDDCFTVGRPHPMIDPRLRTERMAAEQDAGDVAVVLLDVVLGHGSHADPAGAVGPAIAAWRAAEAERGGALAVVASVTGTGADPQGYAGQVATLEAAGALVMPSNAQAARLAARLIG